MLIGDRLRAIPPEAKNLSQGDSASRPRSQSVEGLKSHLSYAMFAPVPEGRLFLIGTGRAFGCDTWIGNSITS